MASLIKILAASLGGGLVLGAGIRLGEALASREIAGASDERGKRDGLSGDLERRIAVRMEKQAAEVAAIRTQLAAETRRVEALGELGARLEKDLPEWIEKSVARRIEESEAELKAEGERSQRESLEAFVEGVQTRVAHRISRLEEEVSMHSAAMSELRACSLRTEASIEKLAGSLDRLLAARRDFAPPEAVRTPAPEPPEVRQAAAAAGDRPSRARRWGLFS